MSRRRSRLHARIPASNVTLTAGNKVLTEAVFRETGPDVFLDGLKRAQGNSVAAETAALVANAAEMTRLSVNRLDRVLVNEAVRREYGLDANVLRSVYRTVGRTGRHSDGIVGFLGQVLKEKYGVKMDTVFMDWTSLYFEAPQQGIVRVGYFRDHRPDRPQVTVGLSMDRGSGMPVGLTVNPGNFLDVTHFGDTLKQVRPLLPAVHLPQHEAPRGCVLPLSQQGRTGLGGDADDPAEHRRGRKPRKKYRNANCFVTTSLSYRFPLRGWTEEAIAQAVQTMTTGREGLFVLVTNRPLSAAEALELYRRGTTWRRSSGT